MNTPPRSPGSWDDQVTMADDFDAPLPSDILDGFLGIDDQLQDHDSRSVLLRQAGSLANDHTLMELQAEIDLNRHSSGELG
jgi:hypothetical protein